MGRFTLQLETHKSMPLIKMETNCGVKRSRQVVIPVLLWIERGSSISEIPTVFSTRFLLLERHCGPTKFLTKFVPVLLWDVLGRYTSDRMIARFTPSTLTEV